MTNRQVETLFCDDIRHEIGGKVSYIGVYAGSLLVPEFPVTLPKLCLSVRIMNPVNEPPRSLTLQVLKDDETLQEISLDEDQLIAALDGNGDLTDDQMKDRVMMMQMMLVFSPIKFDAPCSMRVRVQTNLGELRGVSLQISQAPTMTDPDFDSPGSPKPH